MNCAEVDELIAEFALDSLESSVASAVRSHLDSGCARCNHELDECRAALADYAQARPQETPPISVKAQLLSRINDVKPAARSERAWHDSTGMSLPAGDKFQQRTKQILSLLVATATAILIGCMLGNYFTPRPVSQDSRIAEYQARQQSAQKTFDRPPTHLAVLSVADDRSKAAGQIIWDHLSDQVHVFAFNLAAVDDTNGYFLWLCTDGKDWARVGQLHLDQANNYSGVFDLHPSSNAVTQAVVTKESLTRATLDETNSFQRVFDQPLGLLQMSADFR